MMTYIYVNIIIVILGLYFELINSTAVLNTHKKKLPNYLFIIPSFSLLFIVSAFRGDFTADYKNYADLFYLYNQFDFIEVFQADFYQENGYIFLNRLIGLFTTNELYLFMTVSFVILVAFYSQFNKHSAYIWLSVLMFVTIGSFYTSFNIIRQILAISIIFTGSQLLYERKPVKYILLVLLASLFHKTALVMIIFYFILNLRFSIKNLILIFSGSIVTMLYLDTILLYIQMLFYSVYVEDSYGMTGLSFTNAVVPISILIFSIFHYKKIDMNITIHRVWLNAAIFYAVFNILGLQVQMVQRLSGFFAPYTLLLIPLIFSKMKNNELKVIYMMGLIALLFLYNYTVFRGTGYDPYYFIWESNLQ